MRKKEQPIQQRPQQWLHAWISDLYRLCDQLYTQQQQSDRVAYRQLAGRIEAIEQTIQRWELFADDHRSPEEFQAMLLAVMQRQQAYMTELQTLWTALQQPQTFYCIARLGMCSHDRDVVAASADPGETITTVIVPPILMQEEQS